MRSFVQTVRGSVTALCVLLAGISSGAPQAQAQGGTFPDEPFNGLQLVYSISGASVTEAPKDSPGFTTSRALVGTLESGVLRVSGEATARNGYSADLSVQVQAGSASDSYSTSMTVDFPNVSRRSFDVSVPIPPDATSGSVTISLTGHYNAGSRGVTVRGTFSRAAVQPTPRAAPTTPPQPTPPSEPRPDLSVRILGAAGSVPAGASVTPRVIVENVADGQVGEFSTAVAIDLEVTPRAWNVNGAAILRDEQPDVSVVPIGLDCEVSDLRTDVAIFLEEIDPEQMTPGQLESVTNRPRLINVAVVQCHGLMLESQKRADLNIEIRVPENIPLKVLGEILPSAAGELSETTALIMDGRLKIHAGAYTLRDVRDFNNSDEVSMLIDSQAIKVYGER